LSKRFLFFFESDFTDLCFEHNLLFLLANVIRDKMMSTFNQNTYN